MARYIDADKLKEMIEAKADTLIEGKEAFLYVAKWLDLLPAADVVPREEAEKWYHEFHGVKEELKNTQRDLRRAYRESDHYYAEFKRLEAGEQDAVRAIFGKIEEIVASKLPARIFPIGKEQMSIDAAIEKGKQEACADILTEILDCEKQYMMEGKNEKILL